jgi:hypothetical protein
MSSSVQREIEAEARKLFPAAELETTDGLITAGVAASRAEALRWALRRVREAGPGGG